MKKILLFSTVMCMGWTLNSFSQCSVSLATTNATCNGNCDGVLTAVTSGGTAPYTYSWNTGQTSQTITGLCAGTYSIVITDATTCTATTSAAISQPPALSLNSSSTPPSYCGNNNGTATVNPSGGTPPYIYSWSPSGETTQTATGLSVGNYTVTVSDANGCTITATVVITMPQQPTLSCNSTPTSCYMSNGTATANVSGGTPPYTYLWNPTGQTTQTGTWFAAGIYSVTVTDANGCTGICNVAVAASSSPIVSLTLVQNTVNTLLWYVYDTIQGGTAPFTYLWDFGDGNTSTQPNPTHTYSVAGHYNICLMITDANGCAGSTCDSTYRVASPGLIQTLIVVNQLTGVIESDDNTTFSIYPNPFSTQTTFHSDKPLKDATLTVYNLFGQEVKEMKNISGQSITLQRDNLPGGLYLIRLMQDNKIAATDKLVITVN